MISEHQTKDIPELARFDELFIVLFTFDLFSNTRRIIGSIKSKYGELLFRALWEGLQFYFFLHQERRSKRI